MGTIRTARACLVMRGLVLSGMLALTAGCARAGADSEWNFAERDLPGIRPRIGFVDASGRHVPLEDVAEAQGTVTWTIEDRESVSAEARSRNDSGMEAGASNHFAEALRHFRAAHRLEPRWAQPVYQGAWTALLMENAALAETLYAWTDRMVPDGYWTTKTALDCLRRERAGEFPRGSYMQYVQFEGLSAPERAQALEQFVKRLPTFAPAWKDLAVLRAEPEGRAAALEHGLDARPDRETRAFLLLYKAQSLEEKGARDEAAKLYDTLKDPAAGTFQTMALARLHRRAP